MNKIKSLFHTLRHPPFILILFLSLVIALGVGRLEQVQHEQNAAAGNIEFTDLTATNYQAYLTAPEQPLFIFFAANSSAESQAQEIVLRAALAQYGGRVTFLKLDVDAQPELAQALQVRATPSIILVAQTETGLTPLNQDSGLLDTTEIQHFMQTGLDGTSAASS